MITFQQYLEGVWGQFDYPIPKDKEELLYDFYMLSLLTDTGNEKIDYTVEEVRRKLLPYLKKSLLGAVFFPFVAK